MKPILSIIRVRQGTRFLHHSLCEARRCVIDRSIPPCPQKQVMSGLPGVLVVRLVWNVRDARTDRAVPCCQKATVAFAPHRQRGRVLWLRGMDTLGRTRRTVITTRARDSAVEDRVTVRHPPTFRASALLPVGVSHEKGTHSHAVDDHDAGGHRLSKRMVLSPSRSALSNLRSSGACPGSIRTALCTFVLPAA